MGDSFLTQISGIMTIQYKHKSFYSTHLLKKIMGIKDCFVNKMLARWKKSDRIRLAGMNLPFEIEEKRDIPYMSDSSRVNRNMPQAVLLTYMAAVLCPAVRNSTDHSDVI